MGKVAKVLAGAALCGVGAYGFALDLDYWGFWLIIGSLVIYDA